MVNRFFTFIEFPSRGWFVNFASSRDNTRVLSVGCDQTNARNVPFEKAPFSRETEMAAAQLLLILLCRAQNLRKKKISHRTPF
jgi:hypothetical protein